MNNTIIELTPSELEQVRGGDLNGAMANNAGIGAAAGGGAGMLVWGILAGAALIVSAPISVPFLAAVGVGAAIGGLVGIGATVYYSS